MPMVLGSINHIAICVSDRHQADKIMVPVFAFLGYAETEEHPGLSVWVSSETGAAINLWQAAPDLSSIPHNRYAPGYHHLAFNASCREDVDRFHELLQRIGMKVLDCPQEYGYSPGYYAVFFEGPDGLKFELAYVPEC